MIGRLLFSKSELKFNNVQVNFCNRNASKFTFSAPTVKSQCDKTWHGFLYFLYKSIQMYIFWKYLLISINIGLVIVDDNIFLIKCPANICPCFVVFLKLFHNHVLLKVPYFLLFHYFALYFCFHCGHFTRSFTN